MMNEVLAKSFLSLSVGMRKTKHHRSEVRVRGGGAEAGREIARTQPEKVFFRAGKACRVYWMEARALRHGPRRTAPDDLSHIEPFSRNPYRVYNDPRHLLTCRAPFDGRQRVEKPRATFRTFEIFPVIFFFFFLVLSCCCRKTFPF